MEKTETVGVIAEYNPFHRGHAYQLARIRAHFPAARIAVAMSGSITQRGGLAVLDKWQRAAAAIRQGADLVVELPYAFACRSAEPFAQGGVQLLSALGCTHLAFGAEAEKLQDLQAAAEAAERPAFQSALHGRIMQGASYAAALGAALEAAGFPAAFLRAPNNILATCYLRALKKHAPSIEPLLIHREGAAYHAKKLTSERPSATAIRAALLRLATGPLSVEADIANAATREDLASLAAAVPPSIFSALFAALPKGLPQEDLLLRALQCRLLTLPDTRLCAIAGVSEGLEHRLREKAREEATFDGLAASIATRRYPKSRIRRLLLSVLLDVPQAFLAASDEKGPAYLRVLALNKTGAALLHAAKKRARLPIVAKTSAFFTSRDLAQPVDSLSFLQQMLLYDVRATELRALAIEKGAPAGSDFLQSPVHAFFHQIR